MAFEFIHYKGPALERLFKKWDEILSWYESEWEDLPYWYSERTNIGHLALAVYQLSGIPIQEFSCRKGRGAQRSAGRADLYMYVPNRGGRSIDLNIEAKQAWCSVRFGKPSRKVLKAGLAKATSDCKSLKEEAWRARFGAGILFLLPYAKAMPEDKTAIIQQRRAFTDRVSEECKRVGADFAAFHYPSLSILEKLGRRSADYEWSPGVAVIGKIVR